MVRRTTTGYEVEVLFPVPAEPFDPDQPGLGLWVTDAGDGALIEWGTADPVDVDLKSLGFQLADGDDR